MTYRFNDLANIRQEIAIAAARMIAEEGTSYDVAKRKAARLLLGNSRITGEILPEPTLEEKIDILIHHLKMEVEFRGEDIGVKFMRKFFPYYISGVKNAAKIRAAIVLEDDFRKILGTLNALKDACGTCILDRA